METWQTILLAFGGNAALLAVLGILGKSFLDKLIVRDTKQFESDLKAKTDATIEHLKNELQLRTIEHQVRFSRLHERRAEVIAELYGYLVEALWDVESFLSPMDWAGEPTKKEKHVQAINKMVELYRYFDKNRIYLPPEVCDSLHLLITNVRSQVNKFGVWVRLDDRDLSDDSYKKNLRHGTLVGMPSRMKCLSQERASKMSFAHCSEPRLTLRPRGTLRKRPLTLTFHRPIFELMAVFYGRILLKKSFCSL